MDDEGCFDALIRMFKQALNSNPESGARAETTLVERLEHVQHAGHNWGWGVGDDMDDLMAEYGFAED